MTFRFRHLVAAVLLHVLLFAVLAGGLQCSKKPVRPAVIQAVLLDPDRKEVQQQRQQEQKRVEEQRRREQEQQRRKLEAEQKQREAEEQKRKVAEQERVKKEAEAKKQQELAERKKLEEQARAKKEQQEQKERQEQAQRELQARAAMEQAMREEQMRRQIERESQARAATAQEAKLAEWVDALQRHIAKNWVRPPSVAADFECTVRVQQLPDGTVTNAKISKSCGNAALDKSVEDAVYRSSPMPRPADPSVFDRDLVITFIPQS